jgi:hypothetical protein
MTLTSTVQLDFEITGISVGIEDGEPVWLLTVDLLNDGERIGTTIVTVDKDTMPELPRVVNHG